MQLGVVLDSVSDTRLPTITASVDVHAVFGMLENVFEWGIQPFKVERVRHRFQCDGHAISPRIVSDRIAEADRLIDGPRRLEPFRRSKEPTAKTRDVHADLRYTSQGAVHPSSHQFVVNNRPQNWQETLEEVARRSDERQIP